MTSLPLTDPQYEFVAATDQFPCFCGGFGAGKTEAAVVRALYLKAKYPRQNIAYYLPTYDLVRRIGFPRFEEKLEALRIPWKTNRGDNVIHVESAGEIIFRTMDRPERIVGYEAADSLVDELDTLRIEQARDAWNKIISRNRQKKPDGSINTVAVATTPEGFRFVYERWGRTKTPGYRLIKAATQSNARNLPDGYIQSLRDTYPSNLLSAYLDGEFVNLTAGSVYGEFSRTLNASAETIQSGETLHVGMDFNVTKMAAAIHVMRSGDPHAVAELVNVFDTPAMSAILKERYAGHPIMVYPDPTGKNREAVNASTSDIALLRQAKFTVCAPNSSPAIKDRILATNAMIHKGGERRYRVNPDTCPHLVEALEKQCYDKNGQPDKSTGLDHIIDAATYYIAYRWPIKRPIVSSFTPLRM